MHSLRVFYHIVKSIAIIHRYSTVYVSKWDRKEIDRLQFSGRKLIRGNGKKVNLKLYIRRKGKR